MIKKEPVLCGVAALSLLLGASATSALTGANAKSPQNATTSGTTTQMVSDAEFAKMAAEGGLAEVKFGQLAEQKGTAQAVKDFGKRMVTDHSKANEELKTAAAKDKIAIPSEMSAKDQEVYNQLSKLSGEAFDQAYARDMVKDHKADIADFNHEAKVGKDTAIKNFASQKLPTLEEHLRLAREMEHSVTAKSSNEPKKTGHST